jgi:hypothetical protein
MWVAGAHWIVNSKNKNVKYIKNPIWGHGLKKDSKKPGYIDKKTNMTMDIQTLGPFMQYV